MAKPKYTEEALKLLSPEDLELYKEFQSSGQKYADEFADYKIEGAFREQDASGKPVTETLGTIAPIVVEPEMVDPTTFTEEEAPTNVALVETAEDFLISERERLTREAARPVEEDLVIQEEEGLPAVEPEVRLKRATREDVGRATPIIEKVVPVEGEAPVLDEASQVQKFRAGLKDDERKAWEKFKDELIKQGSSRTEAEARASQLVAGIILTPREIGNYASKIVDATGSLDPEAFAEGNYSISDVFGRQALESTSQFKLRKSREERGAALRKIIEDRVVEELGLWQEGNLPSEKDSFFVALKDRTAGGIDQQKVDAWKANRFTELVQQGEEDIRIKSRAFLIGSLSAEGKEPKEGSPEYKIVNEQADEISKLWLEEVNPELYAKRTDTEKGTLSKAAEYVLTDKDEKGQLYESKTGAGLRDLTGLARTITQPAIRSLTYDVNPDGSPIDPEDFNYKFSQEIEKANTYIANIIGRGDIASIITPTITALSTLGTSLLATGAREVGSGITKKSELSSGNYFNDTAFSIAVGRSLGDDYSDLHAAQNLYGKDSSLPFWFGISTEIALPILPTTAVGGGVARLGGAAAKISPRLGTALGIAGRFIDSPISEGLAPLARRSVEVGKARAIGKAFDIGTKDLKLFDTKPVSDFVAETLAPKIADFILEGKPIPTEFAALADEVGTDITSIVRALGKEIDPTELSKLQEALGKTKVGSYVYRVITDDIVSYLYDTKTLRIIGDDAEVLANPSSYTRARVAAAELNRDVLKGLTEDFLRARSIVDDTGKLSEAEFRELLDSYEAARTFASIDEGVDVFSGIKKRVADLIVADRLAEDLAKANYNDWVFISPTAIVKASKWEKVGAKVDALVKEAIYGTKENKTIEGLIDVGDNTVRLPETTKTSLIRILSEELGAVRIDSNPYWSGVLDKVAAGEKLLVEEVNSIINVVRTNFARTELGTSVVLPRQTSKLTERAAVPLGRRLPLIRGVEDVVRIPVIQKGIDVLTNNRIAQSIARTTRLDRVFTNLNKTIDAAPLPIANALRTLSTRINSLPQELIQDLRTAINAGEEGSVAFTKLIDSEILSAIKVAEDGTVAASEVADLYWDLIRRFFGIQNLPDYKLNETFLSADGPIFSTLDPFTTEGRINLSDISGTLEGRSTIISLMEDMVSATRAGNKDWINKGLKLLTDDAISDLFVAKILDVRKDALINDFAVDLATRNPELVISVNRTEKAKILRDSNIDYTNAATTAYEDIVRVTPDGERWGNPKSVSVIDGVEIISRDVKGLDVRYTEQVNILVRKSIIDELATYISDGKAWSEVENEVYFKVTNSIIKNGVDNAAGISAELSNAYSKIFNVEDILKKVKTNIRTKYPKVNFDDYVIQTDEVSFIPPTKRADLKADIVMNPASFTDDVAISSRIEEINGEIGAAIKPKKSELIEKIWKEGEAVSDEITSLVEEHTSITASLKVTPVEQAPKVKLTPTQRADLKADVVMEPANFTSNASVISRIEQINLEIGDNVRPQKSQLIKKIWKDGENVSDEITNLVEEHARITEELNVRGATPAEDAIIKRGLTSSLIEIENEVEALVDNIVEAGSSAVATSRKALVKERTELVKQILAKEDVPLPTIKPEDVLTNRVFRSRLAEIEDAVDTLVDNIVEEGGDAVATSRKALVKERSDLVKQILEKADVSAYSETKDVIKFSKTGQLVENIRNNIALVTASDIERILELSVNNVKAKLYTLGFDFKSGSGGYEAINAQMKSVGDLKVFLDPDSYKMFTEMTESNKFLNAALEDLSASNKEAKDFIASRFSWALGTLRRNAIGGMLGGIWSLNGRFLGVNNVSAPIIASVTAPQYVGTAILNIPKAFVRPIGRAAAALGEAGVGATVGGAATIAATGSPALAVGGALLGAGIGTGIRAVRGTRMGVAGAAALTYLRQGFRGLTGTIVSDVIITPSGKVFTDVELTAAFRNNVYKMSQYDFDFSSSILQDVKRAGEINEAGYDAAFLEKVRRNYGPLSRNTSAFNVIGSEADYVFREAVFKEALRSGSTEVEAADLARNVLLDYSKVTDWERKLISSWMLFYSFMRQSTVESIQGLFRPDAAKYLAAQARIQKGTEDNFLKRHNAYVAKYASTRMYAWTEGQTYDGYKTGFYGPANPVFESYSRVLGGAIAGVDAYNKEKLFATIAGGTFDVLTSQPHFEFAKNMSLLLQKSPNAPHGYYPSAALAQHVTMGDIELLKDRYDLKPVEDKDGKPVLIKPGEPTWNGRQWKFNTAKGKAVFEADVLTGVLFGYERSLKDWAIATSIANGVDPAGAELKRYKDGNVYLYHVGLQSPMASPEWLRAQEELAKQLSRELQYAAEGKDPNSIIERINAEN